MAIPAMGPPHQGHRLSAHSHQHMTALGGRKLQNLLHHHNHTPGSMRLVQGCFHHLHQHQYMLHHFRQHLNQPNSLKMA